MTTGRGDGIARSALRIAQLSSMRCGDVTFDEGLMRAVIERVNRLGPDLVVVVGDLTEAGFRWEFEVAAGWLGGLEAETVVVPGNHDARNVGTVHYRQLFGDRFSRYRTAFDPWRADRLAATGLTVVAVDSSQPDLDEGHVGRERYPWIRAQFDEPADVKVLMVHHHLMAIPGTGRDLNVITDAGDLLPVLDEIGVDVVLTGHRHVPYFWGLNGMLLCNSGTTASRRTRGLVPPSWNELQIDASTIKVFLHYEDGRRELSVIRSRTTRARIREAFHVTGDFLSSNHIPIA
ncbi:MAG: metallophosphoesterase [Actinobacteria bacterium]|nr:metallophosphoesterase [Actinomycetota bacterium]